MNKKELKQMGALYESAVFIAKQSDLDMCSTPADNFHLMLKQAIGQEDFSKNNCNEVILGDLKKLHEYSKKLHEIVSSCDDIDDWMTSKIVKAADYISEVYHRLDSMQSGEEICCDEEL